MNDITDVKKEEGYLCVCVNATVPALSFYFCFVCLITLYSGLWPMYHIKKIEFELALSLSLFITSLLAHVLFSHVYEWAHMCVLFIIGIVCACDPLWCVYVYVCVCMLSCVHVFCSLSL